jgi:Tol biopolymer transport system component
MSHQLGSRVLLGSVLALLACVLLPSADAGLTAGASAAVAFERDGDLYVTAIDGSGTVRLTKTQVRESEPAVSPDGRRVAFSRGGSGISTMRVDGSHRTNWSTGKDSSPAWAPDGRALFFVRSHSIPGGATCGSIFQLPARGRPRPVTSTLVTEHSHEEPGGVSGWRSNRLQ